MKKGMTIRDIAAEAGVSLATVSRVINQTTAVSEEKRVRVEEAIKKYNYHPNLVARGLKKDATLTIAMLISDGNNEYFGQITKAVENVIRRYRYNLFYCNTAADRETEENYLRLMTERQVDGFIINTTGFNSDYITKLSQHTPFVLLHRRIPNAEFIGDFLDADFGNVSYDLCSHLIQRGHRRIGLICGPSYLSSHSDRLINIQNALQKIGQHMEESNPYFREGPLTQEFGYQSCDALMRLPSPPTAMIITHSNTTIGALRYFREHRIRVPEDISFVSPCDVLLSDILYVKPTCAFPDTWALGDRCGRMLMERILSKNNLPNRESLYIPTISYGDSVRSIQPSE